MLIGAVDSRYSACMYSAAVSSEGATVSSRSCSEDHSDEVTLLVYRASLFGSLTKSLQKRMGTGGMSPTGNREDHEDNEFDIRKV